MIWNDPGMYVRTAMFTTAPFMSGDIKSRKSQSAAAGAESAWLTLDSDWLLKECSVVSEQILYGIPQKLEPSCTIVIK